MKRISFLVLVLWAFGLTQKAISGSYTLQEENDFFAFRDKDGHYTQGLSLSYADNPNMSTNGIKTWSIYGLRNQFYTPTDIAIAEPQPTERPWAGLTAVTKTDWVVNSNNSTMTEYLFGVVGAWSLSEQIQTTVHKWIGSHKPMGWSNQIPDEIVLNVTKKWFYPKAMFGSRYSWGADITETYKGELGNAFVNVGVGEQFRAGYRVPSDYRTEILYPTVNQPISNYISFYGVVGLEGRAIFQNVMLGGSLFSEGPSQILKPFVLDINYGLAGSIDNIFGTGTRFDVSYIFVHRSEEFVGQFGSVDFGSIILSISTGF